MTSGNVVILGRADKPVVSLLAKGAKAAGLRPLVQRPMLDSLGRIAVERNVRALIVDGLRGPAGVAAKTYRDAGIPVIILELPRIRFGLPDRNDYGEVFGLYRDSLADLPLNMANRIRVEGPLPPVAEPSHILLIGQKPNDTAHGMSEADMMSWLKAAARLIVEQYRIPVVFRPHPKASVIPTEMPHVQHISSGGPLRADLEGAGAVVTYNSTAGVEAIDAGVPVLYGAPRHMVCYADYAQPLGGQIVQLPPWSRQAFLMRCGATQWTLDQIGSGLALACVLGEVPYPEPELIEGPEPEVKVPSRTARNLSMSREVVPDGR